MLSRRDFFKLTAGALAGVVSGIRPSQASELVPPAVPRWDFLTIHHQSPPDYWPPAAPDWHVGHWPASDEAIDQLVKGVQRGSSMLLDNVGLTVKMSDLALNPNQWMDQAHPLNAARARRKLHGG